MFVYKVIRFRWWWLNIFGHANWLRLGSCWFCICNIFKIIQFIKLIIHKSNLLAILLLLSDWLVHHEWLRLGVKLVYLLKIICRATTNLSKVKSLSKATTLLSSTITITKLLRLIE